MSRSGPRDVEVRVEVLPHGEALPIPEYATTGASGVDLRAAIEDPVTLAPGERLLVPTGMRVAIPEGFEGQVRARSGVALRHGVGLPNAPGTIDSDYRGELCVLLINWGQKSWAIARGDRIAQLVVSPVTRARLVRVAKLDETERQEGGFGHSGIR